MGGGGKEGGPRVTRVGSSCDGQEEAEHLIYFQNGPTFYTFVPILGAQLRPVAS